MGDIVMLAKTSDPITVRFAVSAVANLAEDKATHAAVVSPEGCSFLVSLVRSDDVALVREVTPTAPSALALGLSSWTHQECGQQQRAHQQRPSCPFVTALLCPGAHHLCDMALQVARALTNLAGNYDTHAQLMGDDAVGALTVALRRRDAVTARFGALGLANLAAVPENHPSFFERSAQDGAPHQALIDVACGAPKEWNDVGTGSSAQAEEEAAAAALTAATAAHEAAEAAAESDDPLATLAAASAEAESLAEAEAHRRSQRTKTEAKMVADMGHDTEARRYSCLALASLAADAGTHADLLEAGVLEALRESLSVDDVETRLFAAFACTKVAAVDTEGQHALMGAAGLVMPLVRLVACDGEDAELVDAARTLAMSALRRITGTVPENRLACVEYGLLGNRVLGDAIVLKDPEGRREAAGLLAHVSLCARVRRLIVASQCLMPLLELCSSDDVETVTTPLEIPHLCHNQRPTLMARWPSLAYLSFCMLPTTPICPLLLWPGPQCLWRHCQPR